MRVSADRLGQVRRFHSAVVSSGVCQVLFSDRKGSLLWCQANSPRHVSMQNSPAFAARIVGVFDASASIPMIAAAVRELI